MVLSLVFITKCFNKNLLLHIITIIIYLFIFIYLFIYFVANAPESDRRDLLSELGLMKKLKPHPHVIKLMGCVTETGKENTDDITEITFNAMIRLSTLLPKSALFH